MYFAPRNNNNNCYSNNRIKKNSNTDTKHTGARTRIDNDWNKNITAVIIIVLLRRRAITIIRRSIIRSGY